MKLFRYGALLLLAVCVAAAYPQTESLGMGAYSNAAGEITLVVDTALVSLKIDSPFVMFYCWMGATHEGKEIRVTPKTVVLIYNGQEYPLATIKEMRDAKYNGMRDDIDIYRRLGKEAVITSKMRQYRYPHEGDFFPVLGLGATTPVEEASLNNYFGFETKLYFKNPGFKKGDKAAIKVWDVKDPNIGGQVDFVIK